MGNKIIASWQFIFFLSISKVIAANSHACARGKLAQSTLKFREKLARRMMNNKLDC